MNICLIGPSGAGKGTHAIRLTEEFHFSQLLTGDLLRENIESKSAIGYLASLHVKRGELVPDEIMNAVVAEWLYRAHSGQDILFDGFPRTLEQAQFLDQQLEAVDRSLDAVLFLKASDDIVTARLQGRLICSSCAAPYHIEHRSPKKPMTCDVCHSTLETRNDDIEALVRVRIRAFNRSLKPIMEYYKESDRLIIVDAGDTLQNVSRELSVIVNKLKTGGMDCISSNPHITNKGNSQLTSVLSKDASQNGGFNLVLIGGPGSGKGTQAEQLQKYFQLPHISTGSLFRENTNSNSILGKMAKDYMDKGELVPDDVTEAMVEERLGQTDAKNGFILDGFPRTYSQTLALTEIMDAHDRAINAAVYIRVSDSEIIRRISGRLICSKCQMPYHIEFNAPKSHGVCDRCNGSLYQRDDDNSETIRARLRTFHSQTTPIINYYRDIGVLEEIDGEGGVEKIIERSISAVKKLMNY